jgi:UTP--glucose-1-phosphate uridylyltransferase
MKNLIETLIAESHGGLDLTDESQGLAVLAAADRLLATGADRAALEATMQGLFARPEPAPLQVHLATKLALSKRALTAIDGPLHVDVVFAMYKEHRRIKPASEDAIGEDFLVRKCAQLDWLVGDKPDATWTLWPVDDGCPEGSGEAARTIVAQRLAGRPVEVLFLKDAIEGGLPPGAGMTSPADSQKGGSVLYGMWRAAQTKREGTHAVIFTDADLSTHLGQVGLLASALVTGGRIAAIGSRREPTSVVIKGGARNDRGKLFIYLWKRLLHALDDQVDTQCGFKSFDAQFIREVAATTGEKRFAVDIELLLQAKLRQADGIEKVGVCWIDSEAASTTTDLQPYLPMLKSITGMYRRYLSAAPATDRFAAFIEGLDEASWQTLLEHIPEAICARHPAEFSAFDGVSVDQLLAAAGHDPFAPFEQKMTDEGLPELAIRAFRQHYALVRSGETGQMPSSQIAPVGALPDADALAESLDGIGQAALAQAVILKLNGGLGTSMGLARAKSLLPVKGASSFLDLIAEQAQASGCPLVLMNSFSTHDDSMQALAGYAGLDVRAFLQHKVPKVDARTLRPAEWPTEADTWCPPGHGDLYTALVTSGVLDALRAAGKRYAFISNADNLGAVLDRRILGYFASASLPFLMEVADRTEADRKGGHLATMHGRLVLRESAQCPADDVADFQDTAKYRYFNTNSIWLDLDALQTALDAHGGVFPMPLIRNEKTIAPRDPSSTPVYQLESAMGAAIALFEGAAAIRVPRTRFAPVKTCADLLRVRSDATELTDDHRLVPNPAAAVETLPIELDAAHFKFVTQLDERFPEGPPSLVACTSLEIVGDVRFGSGVKCVGDVVVQAAGAVCIENETLSGTVAR